MDNTDTQEKDAQWFKEQVARANLRKAMDDYIRVFTKPAWNGRYDHYENRMLEKIHIARAWLEDPKRAWELEAHMRNNPQQQWWADAHWGKFPDS